uniref:Uncharacterized protein n=1 Tax=Arundo donax TaxID=35708 RepID=A0A0A9BS40_ARUDO
MVSELVKILAHFLVLFQPTTMPVKWFVMFPSMEVMLTIESATCRTAALSLELVTSCAVRGSLGFITVGRLVRGSFLSILNSRPSFPLTGLGNGG